MKKLIVLIALIVSLSATALGDGQLETPGKNPPPPPPGEGRTVETVMSDMADTLLIVLYRV